MMSSTHWNICTTAWISWIANWCELSSTLVFLLWVAHLRRRAKRRRAKHLLILQYRIWSPYNSNLCWCFTCPLLLLCAINLSQDSTPDIVRFLYCIFFFWYLGTRLRGFYFGYGQISLSRQLPHDVIFYSSN